MYQEIIENDEAKEKKKQPEQEEVKKLSSMYGHDGKLRQCNEGKYKFEVNEYDHPEWSEFVLHVPKYMTTDSLEVNLFPQMVSIRIKGKLTQVKLWEEIDVPESKIQRAVTTGKLHITMKKLKSTESLSRLYKKEQEARDEKGLSK